MLAGGCYSSKLAKLLEYLLGSASLAILLPSEVGTFSLSVIVCMAGVLETQRERERERGGLQKILLKTSVFGCN